MNKLLTSLRGQPLYRIFSFIIRRTLLVAVTILLGVSITAVIINKDDSLSAEHELELQTPAVMAFYASNPDLMNMSNEEQQAAVHEIYEQMAREAGYRDPLLIRQLRWAWKALTYDLGEVQFSQFRAVTPAAGDAIQVNNVILYAMPRTLLLVGIANFIVFIVGLPLALRLSRQPGSRLDRIASLLAPLSTFPSWVIGLVLILFFAITLRLLPPSGIQPVMPQAEPLELFIATVPYYILPVAAIVINLLFQFVYTWRSYLLSFAHEDYVELARARGLPERLLQSRHILRPSLSFIITSFLISLVSFWQTAIALEVVFGWPGLGLLYVRSLPNFWGEAAFMGELVVTLALVTTFAYLLGATVVLLEVFYAFTDPRVRVDQPLSLRGLRSRGGLLAWLRGIRLPNPFIWLRSIADWLGTLPAQLQAGWRSLVSILGQIAKFPAAMGGLVVIAFLLAGSIYAFIFMPYDKIGTEWYTNTFTGRTYRPSGAMPDWFNVFNGKPLLSAINIDSNNEGEIARIVETNDDGTRTERLTYEFEYPYGEIPQEAFFYFNMDYAERRPFMFWTWHTPDGRELELVPSGDPGNLKVAINEYVFSGPSAARRAVASFPALEALDEGKMPLYYLFSDPNDPEHKVVTGTYRLEIEAIMFEEESSIDAQFVMLGQVFGLGGTDTYRRDLIVPLIWGMPFALVFGLTASVVSISIALFLGAAAVWYGGIVEWFVQRLSDINMVLPVLAMGVAFFAYYGLDIWLVLGFLVVFSSFGAPVKNFRAAFLQVKQESYIEAAKSYGATDGRIIFRYMIPKIMPLLIPQLIYLIPTFVFLEATLGMFNIQMVYPTWGRIIYEALNAGLTYGSRYWVLLPLALVFITGMAFSMVGFALDKILNPKLDTP